MVIRFEGGADTVKDVLERSLRYGQMKDMPEASLHKAPAASQPQMKLTDEGHQPRAISPSQLPGNFPLHFFAAVAAPACAHNDIRNVEETFRQFNVLDFFQIGKLVPAASWTNQRINFPAFGRGESLPAGPMMMAFRPGGSGFVSRGLLVPGCFEGGISGRRAAGISGIRVESGGRFVESPVQPLNFPVLLANGCLQGINGIVGPLQGGLQRIQCLFQHGGQTGYPHGIPLEGSQCGMCKDIFDRCQYGNPPLMRYVYRRVKKISKAVWQEQLQ